MQIKPIERILSPEALWPKFTQIQETKGEAFFLFFGSEDPGTGVSWCPDCVIAHPVVRAFCVKNRPDVSLLECPVGNRTQWKSQEHHPYREHPQLLIQRVPTLVYVFNGKEEGRLVEEQCNDQECLQDLLLHPSRVSMFYCLILTTRLAQVWTE